MTRKPKFVAAKANSTLFALWNTEAPVPAVPATATANASVDAEEQVPNPSDDDHVAGAAQAVQIDSDDEGGDDVNAAGPRQRTRKDKMGDNWHTLFPYVQEEEKRGS